MSARDIAYRIDVTVRDRDGSWAVLVWNLTDPDTGHTHESACHWTKVLGEARRTWEQLNTGQKPPALASSLDGWSGLIVSGVQGWDRYRRAEGWGPWTRRIEAMEGTHEIRVGACAPSNPWSREQARAELGISPQLPAPEPVEVDA